MLCINGDVAYDIRDVDRIWHAMTVDQHYCVDLASENI